MFVVTDEKWEGGIQKESVKPANKAYQKERAKTRACQASDVLSKIEKNSALKSINISLRALEKTDEGEKNILDCVRDSIENV